MRSECQSGVLSQLLLVWGVILRSEQRGMGLLAYQQGHTNMHPSGCRDACTWILVSKHAHNSLGQAQRLNSPVVSIFLLLLFCKTAIGGAGILWSWAVVIPVNTVTSSAASAMFLGRTDQTGSQDYFYSVSVAAWQGLFWEQTGQRINQENGNCRSAQADWQTGKLCCWQWQRSVCLPGKNYSSQSASSAPLLLFVS